MPSVQTSTKKQPRGRPFQKGVDTRRSNIGIGKHCNELIRSHGPEYAVETVMDIMTNGDNDRARLEAAKYWLDRGWGKPDANVNHTIDASQQFIDALREIANRPKVDLIEGEVVEVGDTLGDQNDVPLENPSDPAADSS